MNNPLLKPIRVLLVDDSPLALEILRRVIATDPDIQIVGSAKSGLEALRLIPIVKPTIVCTDYYMPQMNGLEFTKTLMDQHPLPILVISSRAKEADNKMIFSLLEAGALDFMEKPASLEDQGLNKKLIERIRTLSRVFVIKKPKKVKITEQEKGAISSHRELRIENSLLNKDYKLIVIGASTGGPIALLTLLQHLPSDFPFPILCIQHISKGFLRAFVDWMGEHCKLKMKIVVAPETMQPGIVYLSQEGSHLGITANGRVSPSFLESRQGHCPSVNVTMEAVAAHFGSKAIGILLTGMGADGAEGLLAMHKAGALTIAQNEQSCVVFGMPKAAIDLGAAQWVMDINDIEWVLLKLDERQKNI